MLCDILSSLSLFLFMYLSSCGVTFAVSVLVLWVNLAGSALRAREIQARP